MAILDGTAATFNIRMRADLFLPAGQPVTATPVHTGTQKQEVRRDYQTNWYGTGFTYWGPDGDGLFQLTGGTVTDLDVRTPGGSLLLTLSGTSADVSLYANPQQFNGLLLAGDDSITGGGIEDELYGYDGNDTIVAGLGHDTLVGGAGADSLVGGEGHDIVNGGAAGDVLEGGAGNDTYYVQVGADVIVEAADGGNDLVYSRAVQFTMGDHVETGRILTDNTASLRGNAQDNLLIAGGGDNVLDGAGGLDTVSYAHAFGGVTLSLAIATPQATGGSGTDTLVDIEGIVGSWYADDLSGSAGNDTLDGSGGADTLRGGDGDDTYRVDQAGDVVDEAGVLGTDTVISTSDHRLGVRVENLTLTGVALRGLGNGLDNAITGNTLPNLLTGGYGADTLAGGKGNDTLRGDAGDDVLIGGEHSDDFLFNLPLARAGVDVIQDFSDLSNNQDDIVLDDDVFTGLATTGEPFGRGLSADDFHAGAAAADSGDRIIYDSSTGALYYDPDGTGAQAQVQFAIVGVAAHPTLSAADFLVVA